MSTHRIAFYNGKPLWIGSINKLDKQIEETHTFEKAKEWDFHHSFYFQHPEKVSEGGDCVPFFIITGPDGKSKVSTFWREPDNPELNRYLENVLEFDNIDYDDETGKPVTKINDNIVSGVQDRY